jgi:hypothetical protein
MACVVHLHKRKMFSRKGKNHMKISIQTLLVLNSGASFVVDDAVTLRQQCFISVDMLCTDRTGSELGMQPDLAGSGQICWTFPAFREGERASPGWFSPGRVLDIRSIGDADKPGDA